MSAIDKIIGQISKAEATAAKKEDYINAIDQLLESCNDIPLLDLIFKLLLKSL